MPLTDRLPLREAAALLRLTAHQARERRTIARAFRRMPVPVPWAWAEPRLLPLLAGPVFDDPEYPIVRTASELGPAVEFGIDLGQAFAIVDRPVAARWECTAEQLLAAGLANLRRRAAKIEPDRVSHGVMSGFQIRILRDRPLWASSLVLDLDALTRLFGGHDQVIATPTRNCVAAFPLDMPEQTLADLVVDLEGSALTSLFLDPFLLEDGVLRWVGNAIDAFEDDDLR